MDEALLTLLRSVDTPTVCNAIETAEESAASTPSTRGTVMASAPDHRAMVGYARTARISASRRRPIRRMWCVNAGSAITGTCRKGRARPLPWSRMSTARMRSAPIGEVNTNVHKSLASTAR